MQGYKKGHDYGPSWGDFCEAMALFSQAHDKLTVVEIARTPRSNGSECLYFRVVCFTAYKGSAKLGERGEGHSWPCNEWSTVPAMLLAMLHRLDYRLEQERMTAEAQASF